MKPLYFNPELWKLDPQVPTSVGEQKIVSGFNGKPVSAWQIADWNYNWSVIRTNLLLEPNVDYNFTFWLNGGENDRYDEVCYLEIFSDSWDERETFPLKRDLTKPLKYKNGWYLFSIPFTAPENEHVTLRFTAASAITTIAPAEHVEAYSKLESDVIPPDMKQRHNIVFENGWPEEPKPKKRFSNCTKSKCHTKFKQMKQVLLLLTAVIGVVLLIQKTIHYLHKSSQ